MAPTFLVSVDTIISVGTLDIVLCKQKTKWLSIWFGLTGHNTCRYFVTTAPLLMLARQLTRDLDTCYLYFGCQSS